MIDSKRKICLAVPIKTGNLSENNAILRECVDEKPELIELRFDYIDNTEHITPSFLKALISLTKIPIIFTLRSSSEGGHLNLTNSQRLSILKKLIKAQPDYVDIELRTPLNLLKQLIHLCMNERIKIILSYHNFQTTESFPEARKTIKNFIIKVGKTFSNDEILLNSIIFKIIYTATKFKHNFVPLELCKTISEQRYKVISFCMGEMGMFSRITCVMAGSFMTYAALYDETAPGQIHIRDMKRIYSLI